MNRIIAPILLLVVLCSSCISGSRGTVPVEAILPTWEALEPYTRAGIAEDLELTDFQRQNLTRELEVSLELMRAAVAPDPAPEPIPTPD